MSKVGYTDAALRSHVGTGCATMTSRGSCIIAKELLELRAAVRSYFAARSAYDNCEAHELTLHQAMVTLAALVDGGERGGGGEAKSE